MLLCTSNVFMNRYKPVMYAGSGGSSWGQGHMKLPHQMNFLEDLRRAVDAQTGLAAALSTWN
uniref:Uncharacterized protein n=1 Tax=Aegilops tauschii subsp. strangulata TaxID=200361 RepID=A0A453P2H3_AEGTS